MTAKQLTTRRRLLLEKRAELTGALSMNGNAEGHAGDRFADYLDRSAYALETDVQARLRQNHTRLLRAIDAALLRIDRRAFGVCETCDQPIPAARLNAVPWARLCRDCKEQQDSEAVPRLPIGWPGTLREG